MMLLEPKALSLDNYSQPGLNERYVHLELSLLARLTLPTLYCHLHLLFRRLLILKARLDRPLQQMCLLLALRSYRMGHCPTSVLPPQLGNRGENSHASVGHSSPWSSWVFCKIHSRTNCPFVLICRFPRLCRGKALS